MDTGFLRSGRRFQSGKRRKVEGGRRDYRLPREGEYGCESHLDKGSCDEEEEYSVISERAESKDSVETPRTGREYDIPGRSPEVRPRSSSHELCVNTSSPSVRTGAQGSPSVTLVNLAKYNESIEQPQCHPNGGDKC